MFYKPHDRLFLFLLSAINNLLKKLQIKIFYIYSRFYHFWLSSVPADPSFHLVSFFFSLRIFFNIPYTVGLLVINIFQLFVYQRKDLYFVLFLKDISLDKEF